MAVLNKLTERFHGREAFIVATGPSLAYKRMDFLKDFPTMSMNLGFLLFDTWGIIPTTNIFSDKDVLLNNLDLYKQFLTDNASITKILTGRAAQVAPREILDEHTLVLPAVKPEDQLGFEKTPSVNGFNRGNTVVFNALQLAFELGVTEANIVGMDLSTKVEWGKNGHAYEVHPHPAIAGIDLGKRYEEALKKGLPNNPGQRRTIEHVFSLAKEAFETEGRLVRNDARSSLEALVRTDLLNLYTKQPSVTAIVPAKSSSNRVPSKNIRLLDGKPLYLHVIDTLLDSQLVGDVVLDTDSEKTAALLDGRNVTWLKRPIRYATNATDGNALFTYEAENTDGDILVQVLPTAPLLRASTIDRIAYEVVRGDQNDSAFAVLEQALYLWENGRPLNYDISKIPNSVDLKPQVIECMSVYAVERNVALSRRMRFGEKPSLVPITQLEAIDINTEHDFYIAEAILQMRRQNE